MQKILKSVNSFTNNKDKPKFCVYCGNMATQEALFDVGDGVTQVHAINWLARRRRLGGDR